MKPGDIHFAIDVAGNRRPIIILSRPELNRGNYVVAVPITSSRFEERRHFSNCVPFLAGEYGLSVNCVAQGEQVAPFLVRDIDPNSVATLSEDRFRTLVHAMGFVMNATCEPD